MEYHVFVYIGFYVIGLTVGIKIEELNFISIVALGMLVGFLSGMINSIFFLR